MEESESKINWINLPGTRRLLLTEVLALPDGCLWPVTCNRKFRFFNPFKISYREMFQLDAGLSLMLFYYRKTYALICN
jgi:hypothetical protein